MAYTATKEGTNYAVYQDGKRISTTAAQGLVNYGLSESQLSTAPVQTATSSTPQQTFNGYYTTGALSGQTAQGATTQSGYGTTSMVPQQQSQTGVYQATSAAPDPFSQNISYGAVNQPKPQAAPQPVGAQPTAQQAAQQPSLTFNGSIVDLLNSAGMDSSFAARQQLAQQFGVQGYKGTAQQNTDLAKKYLDAYNAKSQTAAPDTGAQASSQLDQFFKGENKEMVADPIASFMDAYGSMNPVEATLFQQLSSALSFNVNQQSLTDFYKQEVAAQGIPELNMELADINRIMEGTEDDIREEVEKSGGFATESQVQALTSGRNKVLLRKANYLSNVLNAKNEYVDRIVSLTQADRKAVSEELDRKLGITKTLFDMSQQMQSAARENYQRMIKDIGYDGLALALNGDRKKMAAAEQVLGLRKGALSDPEFLELAADNKEWSAPYMLGGDYVQENLDTGEIRTAVNVAAGGGGGMGGMGGGLTPTGENYSSLIDLVANKGSSVYQQKSMREGMASALANGDWQTAYQFVVDGTKNSLSGENKTKFENAAIDNYVLQEMRGAIQAYTAAGGDMNILKGTADNIAKRIGVAINDPRYTEVATQLDRAFQQYRQNMTGAAFGAQESRQYASVLPQKSSNLDLNLAVIEGALGYTDNYVSGAINNAIGPQGVEVKQKASGYSAGSQQDSLNDDDAWAAYLRMTSGN